MNSSEARTHARAAASPPLFDARFGKLVVLVNAAVPAALLGWDAFHHALGADGVKYTLHTTGLLGLVFLLLTLVVTPLRRFTGVPQLIALRRSLGLTGFFYLCVHFGIFFVFDRAGSVSSTLHEIVIRRFLQIGTAALVLLVPLAVTSTDRMVMRLGARRWKALHRLAYLATGLGALHYYLSVKADVRQPLAFAGTLALLLALRPIFFVLDRREARERKLLASFAPARPRFWSGELEVRAIVEETPDVRTFRLGAIGGGALPFSHQPGQYLNLALTIDGRRVNRSYTIASSPTRTDTCEITVKRDPRGVASRYLHDTMKEGSRLRVSAPAGRFVFTGHEAESAGEARGVVLVAGGVGITPLMAMVRSLAERAWAGEIFLVFSVREEVDVVFARELASLQRRLARLHVTVTVTGANSPSWSGARGRISLELLRRCVPDLERLPLYLCGPDAMMAELTALLRGAGIPEGRIKTEAFVSLPSPEEVDTGEATAPAVPADATFALRFARSGATTSIAAGQTVLEAAEEAGIELPFECRSGICGQCKTRLLEGRVTMAVQDALGTGDRSRHLVLACQAHAVSDLVLDA
jgi:ferredoxin-NADP reductase/DMSO/TMAO reductase YedYZ heme-binding membrane subunit